MKGYLLSGAVEQEKTVNMANGKSFQTKEWTGINKQGFAKNIPSKNVSKVIQQEDGWFRIYLNDVDEASLKSSYLQNIYKYATNLDEIPPTLDDPNLYAVDQQVFDSIEVESAIKQDQQERKEKAQVVPIVLYQKTVQEEQAGQSHQYKPVEDSKYGYDRPKLHSLEDIASGIDIPNAVFDSGVVQELEKKIEQMELRIHNNLSNIAILEKKIQEQDEVIRDLAFQKNTLNLGQDTMEFLWKIIERMYTFRSCEDKKEEV